jgi:hypothetical protein
MQLSLFRFLPILFLGMIAAQTTAADQPDRAWETFASTPGPLCFEFGNAKPRFRKPGPAPVEVMIRLRFEADSEATCKASIESYCIHHWKKLGYVPDKIEAVFREKHDSPKETRFILSEDCKLATKS